MDAGTRYRINSPNVLGELIDDEVVIVSFETGGYYSLRDTGASVWQLIDAGASLGGMVDILCKATGARRDKVKSSLGEFLEELRNEGLVVDLVGEVPEVSGEQLVRVPNGDFVVPLLERFDEMREMLLYDPVHDVDETGWPNRPAATTFEGGRESESVVPPRRN